MPTNSYQIRAVCPSRTSCVGQRKLLNVLSTPVYSTAHAHDVRTWKLEQAGGRYPCGGIVMCPSQVTFSSRAPAAPGTGVADATSEADTPVETSLQPLTKDPSIPGGASVVRLSCGVAVRYSVHKRVDVGHCTCLPLSKAVLRSPLPPNNADMNRIVS